MRLFKYIAFLLITIVCSCSAYAQSSDTTKYPKVIVNGEDTLLVFTLEQSRELTIINESKKECDTILYLCELENETNQSTIEIQGRKIGNLEDAVERYKVVIVNKDNLISICEEEKDILKDEVSRQKRHKWIAIFTGGIVAILGLIF